MSLAHSQLSKVFLEKTVLGIISSGDINSGVNIFMVIVFFFVFANITIFVLLFMDLMECFLHTLRLHWVEFQNKFYYADGHSFKPLSFNSILSKK